MIEEDSLQQKPFSYTETQGGLVQISYHGRVVTRLSGKSAIRFLSRAESLQDQDLQLLMAKATGNFKRGNERSASGRQKR